MNFYAIPSYINDAMCASEDKAYAELDAIMIEAQPLINAAVLRIEYLAERIRSCADGIKENGLSKEAIHDAGFLNDDNKELQKVIDILIEVNVFKKRLESDIEYQIWRRKAA